MSTKFDWMVKCMTCSWGAFLSKDIIFKQLYYYLTLNFQNPTFHIILEMKLFWIRVIMNLVMHCDVESKLDIKRLALMSIV